MADIHCDSTGNDTTGDGSAGTPYATIQKCIDVFTSGDVIWIGDTSAYVLSVALNVTGATKTTTDPLPLVGWDKSGGAGVFGIADIDCNSAIASLFTAAPDHMLLIGLKVHDTTGTGVDLTVDCVMLNCEVSGAGSYGVAATTESILVNCYVHDNTSYGANLSGTQTRVHACVFVNNGTRGVSLGNSGAAITDSLVIASNGETGIYLNGDTPTCLNCTVIGDTTTSNQSGVYVSLSCEGGIVMNSIIKGFSGTGSEGILVDTGGAFDVRGPNVFHDNTSDYQGLAAKVSLGGDSSTDPNFVDAASGDYTPQSYFDAYLPDFVAGYTTDSNRVMGAVQQAGGGGAIVNQGIQAIGSGINA